MKVLLVVLVCTLAIASAATAANAPIKVATVGAHVVITGKATDVKGKLIALNLAFKGIVVSVERLTGLGRVAEIELDEVGRRAGLDVDQFEHVLPGLHHRRVAQRGRLSRVRRSRRS